MPGAPLVENDLCACLEMSRTPIREALNRLRAEGLVDYFPSRGNFVATISKEKLKKIYEAIEALEGMQAYLLAQDHSRPGFENVKTAVEEMEAAAASENWDDWVVADRKYHDSMAQCCDNEYIVQQLTFLNQPSNQVRMLITKTYIDKNISTKDHRTVYERIIENDPEGARQAAQKHFSWMRSQIMAFLSTYHIF